MAKSKSKKKTTKKTPKKTAKKATNKIRPSLAKQIVNQRDRNGYLYQTFNIPGQNTGGPSPNTFVDQIKELVSHGWFIHHLSNANTGGGAMDLVTMGHYKEPVAKKKNLKVTLSGSVQE